MSPDKQIRQIASEIAMHAHQRQAYLEREKLDLETKLAKKQIELDAANLAGKRFADFPVKVGADFLCPYCWVNRGRKLPLSHSSGTSSLDFLDCDACGHRIEVFIGRP